jgi:two-component system, NtrC family, sensor histidine kinase HydH
MTSKTGTDKYLTTVARVMALCAIVSAGFGASYLLQSPPAWVPFWLNQVEAVIFALAFLALHRVQPRFRSAIVTGAMVLATPLVAAGTYLAGVNGAPFLMTLPLLVALVIPEDPWPTVGSGVACFTSVLVLTLGFDVPINLLFELSTLVVVASCATFGILRFRRVQQALQEQSEHDVTRLTQGLSAAGARLYRLRSEEEVMAAALRALEEEGLHAQHLASGPTHFAVLRQSRDTRQVPMSLLPNIQKACANGSSSYHPALGPWGPHLWPGFDQSSPTVEVPVMVEGKPHGCLCVLSPELRPASAAVIELFAQHIAAAIENVRHNAWALDRLDEVTRLQDALVARERLAALGEAAAVVAHEVRNPLGAIVNGAELLNKELSASERQSIVSMIQEETSRLDRLVNQMLVLARPATFQKQPLNLVELIERCAQLTSHPDNRLTIEATEPDSDASATGDPEYLQLALINILQNAVQASPPNAPITVLIRKEPSRHVILIQDRGPGIDWNNRERIFEPFFTTRVTGTGLGLAIAKRVVEAHHGTLQLQPTNGVGACFEIGLPTG